MFSIDFFREREEGIERETNRQTDIDVREKHHQLSPLCALTRECTCKLGMFPEQ